MLADNKKYEIRITKYKFVLVLFMVLTFFVSFLGKGIYAATPVGTLGACNIEPPEYDANGSKYHYVYFGNIPTAEDDKNMYDSPNATTDYVGTEGKGKYVPEGGTYPAPIRFRVLDTISNDGSTKALFMLTEYAIGQRRWDVTSDESASGHSRQDWYQSEMRAWLNGTNSGNVLGDCFSPEEQAAIASTTTNESSATKWYTSSYEAKQINSAATDIYNNLNSDKIFLLSAKEVLNTTYGFQSDYNNSTKDVNKKCYMASNPDTYYKLNRANPGFSTTAFSGSCWWLRSAYSHFDFRVADVYGAGASGNADSNGQESAVRFGLNVHLSSVIYASIAGVNPESFASSSTFKPISSMAQSVPPSKGVGYQLTIADGDAGSSFNITQEFVLGTRGGNISLDYTGCSTESTETSTQNICAIIKGSSNYFARPVVNVESSSGTINLTLPNDIEPGSYTMIVYNETNNGSGYTNVAKYDTVVLKIKGNPVGTLGVCNIEPPEYNANGSKYHYVYFGTVPTAEDNKNMYDSPKATTDYVKTAGKGKYVIEGGTYPLNDDEKEIPAPIRFRVLDTTSNGNDATSGNANKVPALFMLTEYAIGQRRWDVTSSEAGSGHSGQEWKTSEMRRWLNGYTGDNRVPGEDESPTYAKNVLGDCFSEEERAAIVSTTTNEDSATKWYSDSYEAKQINSAKTDEYNNLSSDKIFLLSAEEVLNETYGFQKDYNYSTRDVNKKCYLAGNPNNPDTYYKLNVGTVGSTSTANGGTWWWLRSACSNTDYSVADVNGTGASRGANSYDQSGAVRFGLNVHLSSVIYASDASVHLASPSTFKPINSMAQSAAPSKGVGYQLTIADGNPGSSFSITQSTASGKQGATIPLTYSGCNTGSGQNICVVLKRKNNNAGPHYFAMPKINVPSTEGSGSLNLTLPIDIPYGSYTMIVYNEEDNGAGYTNVAKYDTVDLEVLPPTISQVYRNNDNTGFKVTASDNSALSKIADSTNGETTYVLMTDTSDTKNFTTTSAIDKFRVYNNNNQYTEYTVSNATLDDGAPTGSVTYGNGGYTITAADSESGLWKIELNGDIIKNCEGSYPTSQQSITGIGPIPAPYATLYDAVNNPSTVMLDNVAPSITRAYKHGMNAMIGATDSGSGLWKIAESIGGAARATLEGTNQVVRFTLSNSDVTTVYVYDNAGNYTEVILNNDNTPPIYEGATYDGTSYTIRSSDLGSGIWKITNETGDVIYVRYDGINE